MHKGNTFTVFSLRGMCQGHSLALAFLTHCFAVNICDIITYVQYIALIIVVYFCLR